MKQPILKPTFKKIGRTGPAAATHAPFHSGLKDIHSANAAQFICSASETRSALPTAGRDITGNGKSNAECVPAIVQVTVSVSADRYYLQLPLITIPLPETSGR